MGLGLKSQPYYPLLAAIYPVLSLAERSKGEWFDAGDLVLPILISLGWAALVWAATAQLTRDRHKQAFLTWIGVGIFAQYGNVVNGPSITHRPGLEAVVLLVTFGAAATTWTVRSLRSFAPVSRFLAIFTVLLVGMAVVPLVASRLSASGHIPPPAPIPLVASKDGARPTIYFIILDKYTGSNSLRKYYGYDNSPFERALQARGFYVPHASRANYVQTRLAIASMLNWSYLDPLVKIIGRSSRDWRPLFSWIEDNRAIAFLKGSGYQFVFVPSWYPPTTSNRHAELTVASPRRIRPEFLTIWASTTLWGPIVRVVCHVSGCDDWEVPESASMFDWQFEQLGPLAASTHPRFVLAHFILPHEPYLYRADCSHRRPLWNGPPDTLRAAYVAQIQCVNLKVLRMVDAIRSSAVTPPVILLQADHGHGQGHTQADPLGIATPAHIDERTDIFAAYEVPGAPDSLWYETITPINVLPAVFNQVFGLRLNRRPDQTYWSSEVKPYDFTTLPSRSLR